MAECGSITINEIDLLEVDADPCVPPGIPDAPAGTIAVLKGARGVWQKLSSANTDWVRIDIPKFSDNNPKSAGIKPLSGVSQQVSRDDHVHDIVNLTNTSFSPRLLVTNTVSNGTLALTVDSNYLHIALGSAAGFKYKLPDALTLTEGWKYEIFNRSAYPVGVAYSDGSILFQIPSMAFAQITLEDNATSKGFWNVVSSALAETDVSIPNFASVTESFEDFLFDSYSGTTLNDNMYSFTPVPNGGLSTLDGAVTAVGNDYEGIHVLDSLTSATARPMLEAFNLVNRIKFGAQQIAYEIRARVETLAINTQKFTTRYGLMDVDTSGLPANGVLFSYDPIYPVTAVAQVVTATPTTLSVEPTQSYIQGINGVDYEYLRKVKQTVVLTPISLPQATYQQISITWTRANNTTYTVTINGNVCSYTSDATATDAEIAAGLGAAINAKVGTVVTAGTTGKPITVTADAQGQGFTYSTSANVTATLVTANVPIAQYVATIAGVNYTYSDATPTAARVVAGLASQINADTNCPASASGTTTLNLASKVDGVAYTYSANSNLSQSNTTSVPTASEVVTYLKNLIAADVACAVTPSGTTTLVLTAKTPGTGFIFSGSGNMQQSLTVANVVEVLYSGNWMCSVIKNSTVTTIDSGIPVVPGQWYQLKAVMRADGNSAIFYIDNVFIDEIKSALPSVALRYIFKLEKTLGTQSRTTSIDYIAWKRTR